MLLVGVESEFCIVYSMMIMSSMSLVVLRPLQHYTVCMSTKLAIASKSPCHHLGFCLITAQQVRIKSSLLPQHSHTRTQISLHVKNPGLLSLSPCRWRSNIQPSTIGFSNKPPQKKQQMTWTQKWDTTTTKNPSCREAARPLGLDVGGPRSFVESNDVGGGEWGVLDDIRCAVSQEIDWPD